MPQNTSKIALITGANKGIGFETSRRLGKQGITILVGARNKDRGQEAVEKLRSEGVDSRFAVGAVTVLTLPKALKSIIYERTLMRPT